MSASRERGETSRPRAGELRRRRSGLVAGVALIAPGRIQAGLDLGYAELCRRLGECLLDPDADPAMVVARSQGYAMLAVVGRTGMLLSVLTTEVDKAATTLVMWEAGIAYDEDFALTTDTVIAWLYGWPIPLVFDPTVSPEPSPARSSSRNPGTESGNSVTLGAWSVAKLEGGGNAGA